MARLIRIPLVGLCIARLSDIRKLEQNHAALEREFKKELWIKQLRIRNEASYLHQIAVLTGRLHAPVCQACGKPKTAGGIRWDEHKSCIRQKTVNEAKDGNKNEKYSADGGGSPVYRAGKLEKGPGPDEGQK